MLTCTSGILYLRAGVKPIARQIKAHKGIVNYLKTHIQFDQIIVPHFYGARPFWRSAEKRGVPPPTNSGPLGKLVANLPQAYLSKHPSHPFVGCGDQVVEVLAQHTGETACFFPIRELAEKHDFSMLLLGCVDESPGFSTVHAAQNMLGLTQRHLMRYLVRWDEKVGDKIRSRIAPEVPGCSSSFDKFYPYYLRDQNLVEGEWDGVRWMFIPSARKALATELMLLKEKPRFVDCGNALCPTCGFRSY
jgi:hypothetical protein